MKEESSHNFKITDSQRESIRNSNRNRGKKLKRFNPTKLMRNDLMSNHIKKYN